MLKRLLERVFATDLRSLAAFRIATACIVLFDILTRLPLLAEFYSDSGMLPRALVPFDASSAPVAFHMLGGSVPFQYALFGVGFAGALGMLVGWHTRVCTTIVYLHQLSLLWRNPLVLNGGDYLLIWLLFWCLFLPLGARFSLDARRAGAPSGPGAVLSFASAGLLVQYAGLYFFSVFHKVAGEGWIEGTAVLIAVSHEVPSRALGSFLSGFPDLLRLLTWGVLAWEAIGPLLLLSPVATRACRLIGIAGFAGLHIGLGLSIQLWLFPWVSVAGLLPFLPGSVWDAIQRRSSAPDGPPPRGLPWSVAWLPALALAYVLFSNVERLQDWDPPYGLARAGRMLGLNQGPSMYSTQRPYDVELHVVGGFEGGQHRTIDDGRELRWPSLDALRSDPRGKLYLERLAEHPRQPQHEGLGLWICERWNAVASERLRVVSLVRVRRTIRPDGSRGDSVRKKLTAGPCPTPGGSGSG